MPMPDQLIDADKSIPNAFSWLIFTMLRILAGILLVAVGMAAIVLTFFANEFSDHAHVTNGEGFLGIAVIVVAFWGAYSLFAGKAPGVR